MTHLTIPNQSALLYRQHHLTGIPATPGGPTPTVTEILYLNQYGDTIIATMPHTNLGHGIHSPGEIKRTRYISAYVAAANYRAALTIYTQPEDGWTIADLEHFVPGDPTTLKPAPRHHTPIGTH